MTEPTAADLITALDAACMGPAPKQGRPEKQMRKMGNGGVPLHYLPQEQAIRSMVTTHTASDLCTIADVIARFRDGASE